MGAKLEIGLPHWTISAPHLFSLNGAEIDRKRVASCGR
jgi:hypothetical protein